MSSSFPCSASVVYSSQPFLGALCDIPKMAAEETKLEKATLFVLPLHINRKIIKVG